MPNPYAQHNEQNKANFDHVYDLPDPRGYFEALGSLDYLAPEHGRRLFPTLLQELRAGGGPDGVLDLCCSYGVNAALLGHDLTLKDLYAHYASPELADFPTEGLLEAGRAFYASTGTGELPASWARTRRRTPSATRSGPICWGQASGRTWSRSNRPRTSETPSVTSGSSPSPAVWATSGSAPSTAS